MTDPIDRLNAALESRYRIERGLGEGGMAVVYLADDLKHDRQVALKVLKPELAAVVGAERFLGEIKTTAHLQHPHILPLFDSGEAGGFLYYVMPYVEGESLRDRLDRERQLPVDEAVRLARDLAEALDYAHEHGVIHRDIKPANILMQGGRPVISDFGIALAVGSAGGARLTETGLSVGTPYYMSPEQATGDRMVGPPSDVYSLACVLFEMLVGDPPYPGSTAQAVLGKIIAGAPVSATEHRRSVPAHVDAAIRKALEKLPADRFSSAADFARALADEGFRYAPVGAVPSATADDSPWKTRALLATALAILAVGWGLTASLGKGGTAGAGPQVVRFSVPVDPDGVVRLGNAGNAQYGRPRAKALAVSPDGELLVYGGWRPSPDGSVDLSSLYLRRLDQETVVPLSGTEGAATPFFSPDGAWIGFFLGGGIRRRSVSSGDVETVIAEGVDPGRGFGWSAAGEIFVVDVEGRLLRVPQAGGDPVEVDVGSLEEEQRISHPSPLPGGRILLFSVLEMGRDYLGEIRAVDLDTGTSWRVLEDAMDARFVDPGHLLFMRNGALMAVAFDPDEARAIGTPLTMLDDVMQSLEMPNSDADQGTGQYSVSASGDLAYVPGGVFPVRERRVVRIEPDGRADTLDVEPREYVRLRVSPDGSSLALITAGYARRFELFVHDLERGVTRRLNTGGILDALAVWSPDGRELAYRAVEDGALYRIPASGGDPVPLEVGAPDAIVDWASNGDILYTTDGDYRALTAEGTEIAVLDLPTSIAYGAVSPDGRWIAYATTETGRREVYVRPYPGPGPPTLVSAGGGSAPAWSRDGSRLFYRGPGEAGGDAMMALGVTVGNTFDAGLPSTLIDAWSYNPTVPARSYDPGPGGGFYALTSDPLGTQELYAVEDVHVFLDFSSELERRFAERASGGR